MRTHCLYECGIQIIELIADKFDLWHEDIHELLKISLDSNFVSNEELNSYINKKCSEMKQYLRGEDTVAFLACDRDKPVGWIWCHEIMRLNKKILHIAYFSVLPEYQGHGVGRRLLSKVENCAVEAHYAGIDLLVTASNEKALKLYEQNGFQTSRYLMQKIYNL